MPIPYRFRHNLDNIRQFFPTSRTLNGRWIFTRATLVSAFFAMATCPSVRLSRIMPVSASIMSKGLNLS